MSGRASRGVHVAALAVASACAVACAAPPPCRAQVPPGFDGAWSQPIPDGRNDHAVALDPAGRMLYLYGGRNWTLTDDFLAYRLDPAPSAAPWRRLPSAGVPGPARITAEALAWDTRRGRLLELGGAGDHPVADGLWVFDPQQPDRWQGLATQGPSPGAPQFAAVAYDSLADALRLYGGDRGGGDPTNLWTLSFATDPPTWSARPTGGSIVEARAPGTMFVENSPHRLVRVCNLSQDGRDQVQIRVLPLDVPGNWVVVDSAGDGPRGRAHYPAALDPIGRRLFVVPDGIEGLDRLDTWEFDLDGGPGGTGWRELPLGGTSPRPHHGHRLAYDVARQRLLLAGGWWSTPEGATTFEADALWLDPAARDGFHSLLGDAALSPTPRTEYASAVDRSGQRFYVYGGVSDIFLGDLWSLDFADTPRWHLESATPPDFPAHAGASGAFDSRRSRFLVLMGTGTDGAYDDVHAWDPATRAWSRLDVAGPGPAARDFASAVYDSVGDRVLLFGGLPAGLVPANDLWALELAPTPHWRRLAPLTGAAPPGRFRASAALDTRRGDWWVYGGETIGTDGFAQVLDDVWCLHLEGDGAWRPLDTSDHSPAARANAGAAYDPLRDRVVFLWGTNVSGARRTDGTALTLGGMPRWRLLALAGSEPYPRAETETFWDERNDRMFMFGGSEITGFPAADTWFLDWSPPAIALPQPAVALRARARPNPSASGVAVEFALSAPGRVDCAVFDLAGRRVRALAAGTYPAGPVTLGWDGRNERGARVSPGVYWARLTAGSAAQTFQLVLLR